MVISEGISVCFLRLPFIFCKKPSPIKVMNHSGDMNGGGGGGGGGGEK